MFCTMRHREQKGRGLAVIRVGKHGILVDGKLKPRKLRFVPHCWAQGVLS